MIINELLSTPYPFTRKQAGVSNGAYYFTTADGMDMAVLYNKISTGIMIIQFRVEFGGSPFHLTGRGDAYRVLSTVIAAIEEFVKITNAKGLAFGAAFNEPSRTPIYRRLSHMAAKKHHWQVKEIKGEHSLVFLISTPEILDNEHTLHSIQVL